MPYVADLTTRFVIYVVAAVSFDLIPGYGAMVGFGHTMFVGLGGYIVASIVFYTLSHTPSLG
ncbi:UNVERIFIED_ORG: ABC-type branched-subunit amino acid transport system permease subunit [Paraburkholderia sediminicola]|nr:ABC-type branched-subunit amino acid transport system permease subunit [Paraburkholderia sediminicola]